MKDLIYAPTRPNLVIEDVGGGKLGNCYYGTTYRITSRHQMGDDQIHALAKAGVLGYGQEFYIRKRVEPAGEDELKCVVYVDGKRTDEVPVNYAGTPITNTVKQPFYVYECERRVDSSD